MKNTISEIITENARRMAASHASEYIPITGLGCNGSRIAVTTADGILHLPEPMVNDPRFSPSMPRDRLDELRDEHDFEFWAARNILVKDKTGWELVPFTLNMAQRRVLAVIEQQRINQQPIRFIVLKARQMGCSTLIQIYMMWIQLIHRTYWNSVVCSQSNTTSTIIRDIYRTALDFIPVPEGAKKLKLTGVPGASSLLQLPSRNCRLAICASSHSQNVRGADLAMAHLSEVAYWSDTEKQSAENTIAAICASIVRMPLTIVAMESTAHGVGNYFHNEWMRACDGRSDKTPIFVPWYEIDSYRCTPPSIEAFWNEMNAYEMMLWEELKLPLDRIYWYHLKRMEYPSDKSMMAEYPTTAVEAFAMTSDVVFDQKALEEMRRQCVPAPVVGTLEGLTSTGSESLEQIQFHHNPRGELHVWEMPDHNNAIDNERLKRYIVSVDIGGRSDQSDWSVIAVMDRENSASPRVVAQWRGHCDHDILAWHAARIARWYCNALLIIESNTIETDRTEGDHGEFILHELQRAYRNIYKREPGKPGFHTNRASKNRIINDMIGYVRNRSFVERDNGAIDEALTYERKRNGATGAIDGHHDDRVMARAMALSIAKELHLRALRTSAAQLP